MPKRGENIYKRKDGRWEGRYVKGISAKGKRTYGSVYGKTYKEAKDKLAITKMEWNQIDFSIKNDDLIQNIVRNWLTVNQIKLKESSYVKYHNLMERHIIPHLGMFQLKDINSIVLQTFTDHLLKQGRLDKKGGLSPRTVTEILTVLHSAIILFQREHPSICLPFDIVYPKNRSKDFRIFTLREQKILEKELLHNPSVLKIGIWIALYTGIRQGELCALRWSDIDLENCLLYVRRTMQRIQNLNTNSVEKTKIVIEEPKSQKSKRCIPLPDFVCHKLLSYQPENSDQFFLTNRFGHNIEPRSLQYQFKAILKKINLPLLNYHTLRHTFACRCVEMGFDVKSLSEILGHSSTTVTLDRYVHSSHTMKVHNMNRLGELYKYKGESEFLYDRQ